MNAAVTSQHHATTTTHADSSAAPRHGLAITLTLLGLAATCVCGILAGNAYYHLDDVTHFLYAKWSWRWPTYLLDDWGRPGFTVAYWLPSSLGWTACRLFSALLTAAAAWFAYVTARRIELPRAWLVIPLCYTQPLVFQLSQTTLTETPLAFYLSLATWLAVTRRWTLSSIVLSAAFVTRHEAVMFLPIWIWFAWKDKAKWYALAPLLWAPIIVNGVAASLGMSHLISRFLDPTPTAQYGRGGWLTYFVRALHAYGPVVSILAIVGLRGFMRSPAAMLVAASAVIYFIAQTIVYRFGLFASGGYSRFLIGIAPLVAIIGVNGVNQLLSKDRVIWRSTGIAAAASMVLLWMSMERQLQIQHGADFEMSETHQAVFAIRILAAAFSVLGVIVWTRGRRSMHYRFVPWLIPGAMVIVGLLTCYGFHRPLSEPADARLIELALREIESRGLSERRVITAHPFVELLVGGENSPHHDGVRKRIEQAPIGSLIVWESRLSPREDHKLYLDEFVKSPAFREVLQSGPLPYQDQPYLHVFEKTADWGPEPRRVASPATQS